MDSFSSLIKELDELQYESRYVPFPLPPSTIPNIFLTSSASMRNNFKIYGQFVAVDVTYNLIRDRVGSQRWGVILLMGLNNNNHIIPFALGILNNES